MDCLALRSPSIPPPLSEVHFKIVPVISDVMLLSTCRFMSWLVFKVLLKKCWTGKKQQISETCHRSRYLIKTWRPLC